VIVLNEVPPLCRCPGGEHVAKDRLGWENDVMNRKMFQSRSTRYRLAIVIAAFAGVLLVDAITAYACPGCKQALATAEGEQGNMVNGYFWSILFMLSMPFTLLGLFAGSMYLAVRKARAAAQTMPAPIVT
jgi:hypothetical protein